MNDISAFLAAIGDIPSVSDPLAVRRKSRDMATMFSPILKRDFANKKAEVVVSPRTRDEVMKVASAAARHRVPLLPRGGGSANFGQNTPLKGGAVLDMTALDKVLWVNGPVIRAEAGAKVAALDAVAQPTGWELRIHPSTRKMATIGGFIGGGHAGIGSCAYGIMRDRGNIRGLQVMSVEEVPRLIELRGDDVNLVHHAYGANGIITEVELPLAPAWTWREAIVTFPEFMTAVEFSYTLAVSDGIVKKLISLQGTPIPTWIERLSGYVPQGHSMVLCMIAEPSFESFEVLVKAFGGTVQVSSGEGAGPYGSPIYEYAWGHTRLHINNTHPSLVSGIGLYAGADLVSMIRRSHERFGALGPMHFEVKRFDGKMSFQGSPLFPFVDDDHMAGVMAAMAEDGAMVANNHTFLVKQGGMKSVTVDDARFKREMDPYDLMNPGKLSFDQAEEDHGSGAALPSAGWSYDAPKYDTPKAAS